jgi:hypothetical protein
MAQQNFSILTDAKGYATTAIRPRRQRNAVGQAHTVHSSSSTAVIKIEGDTDMSEATAATPTVTATPAPAKQPSAIQLLEAELVNFVRQKEQTIANLHVIDGAIQATQVLIGKFKAEIAKAEAEAKKLAEEGIAEVEKLAGEAETEAEHVATEVKDKVVSIASAVEKQL